MIIFWAALIKHVLVLELNFSRPLPSLPWYIMCYSEYLNHLFECFFCTKLKSCFQTNVWLWYVETTATISEHKMDCKLFYDRIFNSMTKIQSVCLNYLQKDYHTPYAVTNYRQTGTALQWKHWHQLFIKLYRKCLLIDFSDFT